MPALTASLCRSASVPASFRPCWYVWPPAPSRILPAHFIISCWLPTPCGEIRPVPDDAAAGTLQAPGSQTSAPGQLGPSQKSFLFGKWPNRISVYERKSERGDRSTKVIIPLQNQLVCKLTYTAYDSLRISPCIWSFHSGGKKDLLRS